MRFQVGRVDHDDLLFAAFGGQPLHHPGEDTHVTPPLPAIVEGSLIAALSSVGS